MRKGVDEHMRVMAITTFLITLVISLAGVFIDYFVFRDTTLEYFCLVPFGVFAFYFYFHETKTHCFRNPKDRYFKSYHVVVKSCDDNSNVLNVMCYELKELTKIRFFIDEEYEIARRNSSLTLTIFGCMDNLKETFGYCSSDRQTVEEFKKTFRS